MPKNSTKPSNPPSIVRYTHAERHGIQAHYIKRHAIGYVIRGMKHIYYGDECHEVSQGKLFYLGIGNHYVENIPDGTKPFEQIVVYFSAEELYNIISQLNISFGFTMENKPDTPPSEEGVSHIVSESWGAIQGYFTSVSQYIKDGLLANNKTAEMLKMTELVYLIASNPECRIRYRILHDADSLEESFEHIVHKHLLENVTIEELAELCNRSLSAFKKEFKRKFHDSPHKWITRQRLMRARLLLSATGKSIAEISNECRFANTSHFIKLFKSEYDITPAVYRAKLKENSIKEESKGAK